MLAAEVPAPSTITMPCVPLPRIVLPTSAPFYSWEEAPVIKALIPVQFLVVIALGQEGPPQLKQHTGLVPLLAPPLAGVGAPVMPGLLTPLGSCPKDPQDACKTAPVLDLRAPTSRCSLRFREMDADRFPWCFRQSSPCHASPSSFFAIHGLMIA
jgi:hypothetical protein